MAKKKPPVTPAIRALRAADARWRDHLIDYAPRGGTAHTAATLGVDEHRVIKTLVFEDEHRAPLLVLMHGDRTVSTKTLARHLDRKAIAPCDPQVAQRHSGYQVGGTSPFGLRTPMPIYYEATIAELPALIINGGKRGYLLQMTAAELLRILDAEPVQVATTR